MTSPGSSGIGLGSGDTQFHFFNSERAAAFGSLAAGYKSRV